MFHPSSASSSTCLSPAKTETETETETNKKMGVQHHENMNLVLSTDAKPRLKWTQELHQRFVEAVNQLGGADKATPKSLMRVMGISGLTLYHLKSHLQKYRLGKSQHSETSIENKQEVLLDAEYKEIQSSDNGNLSIQIDDGNLSPINESFKISQALQMQMEVQRKLHEQIEVQRHLQLRIEAQGKYLQTVLKKAQETLSGYNSSSAAVGIELAKAELSQLVSMVNTECPSSSISGLTETGGSTLKDTERKQMRSAVCSMDSSLTSSESSGRKNETGETDNCNTPPPVELSLMDIQPWNRSPSNQGKRRDHSIISGGTCVEQPLAKRSKSGDQLRESDLYWGTFDLNRHYQHEIETSQKGIDLNCKGTEQLDGN